MKTLTTISLAFAVAAAGAQTTSQSQIRHIETSLNHLTVLEFGESVTTIALADPDSFQVERHDDKVFVKPLREGISTNLFVWTASRELSYELTRHAVSYTHLDVYKRQGGLMNTSTVQVDEVAIARPKYYEMDGALRANANRAWLLAFLTIPIALVAIGFAIFVRMQPPTVIRIGPNGDASVLGKPAKGAVSDLATGGTDEFLDEAFVKRFLTCLLYTSRCV